MNAIIENLLILAQDTNETTQEHCTSEFITLLNWIQIAKNENDLKRYLKSPKDGGYGLFFVNFKIGFGNSHMWVHQILKGETSKNRLVIVRF